MKQLVTLHKTDWEHEVKEIVHAARISHGGGDLSPQSTNSSFIKKLISMGHESPLEFGSFAAEFITDRGVSHELVRHRLCSFMQESTRYVPVHEYIEPEGFEFWKPEHRKLWISTIESMFSAYHTLIKEGVVLDNARSLLPTAALTVIVIKANFREWRHIFKLRTTKYAHHHVRKLMQELLNEVKEKCPEVFGDL